MAHSIIVIFMIHYCKHCHFKKALSCDGRLTQILHFQEKKRGVLYGNVSLCKQVIKEWENNTLLIYIKYPSSYVYIRVGYSHPYKSHNVLREYLGDDNDGDTQTAHTVLAKPLSDLTERHSHTHRRVKFINYLAW